MEGITIKAYCIPGYRLIPIKEELKNAWFPIPTSPISSPQSVSKKKASRKPSHRIQIKDAILSLKERSGSLLGNILKFLNTTPSQKRYVNKALKKGVDDGFFVKKNNRYKLSAKEKAVSKARTRVKQSKVQQRKKRSKLLASRRKARLLRKKWTESQKLHILYGQGYKCNRCKESIHPDCYDLDHIVELQDGGSDTRDNLQALCCNCHRIKTAECRRARKAL